MPLTKRKRTTTIRAMAVAGLIAALMWTSVMYLLQQAENMQREAVERNLSSVTQAIVAHSNRTLQWIDHAALLIRQRYLLEGESLDLNELVNSRDFSEPLFVLLSIADSRGALISSSQPYTKGLDLSDREHIKEHFTRKNDFLFPGRPVIGRVSGKPSIQFTRKILNTNGTLAGIVVVSVDPYYFTATYQSLNLGEGGRVELFRSDGLALVRHQDHQDAVGVDISGTDLFKHAQTTDGGIFHLTDEKGKETLWAYSELEGKELHVAVAMDLDEQMLPITHLRVRILIMAVLLSMTIFGLAWAVVKYIFVIEKNRLQAIEANQKKSGFLSNVSHELRTPLNGILGYTELLLLNEKDKERGEFLRVIYDSGAHLLSLVDSLLALSRIERGLVPLQLRREALHSLLSGVVQIHMRSAHTKGVSLSLHVARNVPAYIFCDRVKLTQILHNLIRNAVKFTDRGSIIVSVECRNDELVIAVQDTGRGIERECQEHLFDTFFQIKHGDAQGDEGFGLGLPIVKQLTDLMEGRVRVESYLGKGTTFTLHLPLRAAPAPAEEPTAQKAA
ncbi:sensor histidine kinase [Parapusillimonas granuli]|uniref:Virulence sensor protein BvgS n=1 Tax=Parapusillimonas granuli TaxID=380911 RepID=A0A853FV92_9BURK|nr:ATP-binding protein [Parapusillimonas granuli]MBB5213863.1 signal transduction histidine kinase [Parapusillimonas granuli]MEB2398942.1 ATP-binding protein [Alcaligenaceae bacterium]NYT48698.1 hypothetical protein [Parapusillimonas granuli]